VKYILKKAAQNRFYNDILANNPGTKNPEKRGKKLFEGGGGAKT
jgi:hypothetical protein